MKQLILASTSPRRKEILSKTRLDFTTEASDYEEDMTLDLPPNELVQELSLGKAKDVATKHENAIVIGADTIVVFNDKILGKPTSEQHAKEILQMLSGQENDVWTGFTIIDTKTNKTVSKAIRTRVFFRDLTEQEIDSYIATGEPMDKAGAYGIQDLASIFIEKIEGDYFNIMGFPLFAVVQTLKDFDIHVL